MTQTWTFASRLNFSRIGFVVAYLVFSVIFGNDSTSFCCGDIGIFFRIGWTRFMSFYIDFFTWIHRLACETIKFHVKTHRFSRVRITSTVPPVPYVYRPMPVKKVGEQKRKGQIKGAMHKSWYFTNFVEITQIWVIGCLSWNCHDSGFRIACHFQPC